MVRKFYLSLLSVLLLTFIFGTVTYAWIIDPTSVEGLSLTATTGSELLISVDGENYSQSLSPSDIEALFREIFLIDVTSMDGINFYTGGVRERERAIENEHYISFELWFQTTQPERHVYLVNNVNDQASFTEEVHGTYVISRGVPWIAKTTFLNGPNESDIVQRGDQGIYFGSDAVRISVIELRNEDNPLDTRADSEFRRLIYDPSENPERGFGKYYGSFNYFMAIMNYTNFRLPTVVPPTVYQLTQFPSYDPFQALDNQSQVMELIATEDTDADGKTYYRGKIRVNIWVEGWDADAFDAINEDILRIQLQFKAARPYIEQGQN